MKKRKTAAFLAALMICAWVPQAVPGDFGVLVAEAHSGRTDRYGGHPVSYTHLTLPTILLV